MHSHIVLVLKFDKKTTFGGHIKRLNIKFEFGKNKHWYPSNVTNWNVQKIQNFLGIFNLIMTKARINIYLSYSLSV